VHVDRSGLDVGRRLPHRLEQQGTHLDAAAALGEGEEEAPRVDWPRLVDRTVVGRVVANGPNSSAQHGPFTEFTHELNHR
jgi:hypothetical protein